VQTAWPASTTITAGAQANPDYGTAIDLDLPAVLTSAAANQSQGTIDLLFAYDTAADDYELLSPYKAYQEDISVAAHYDPTQVQDIKLVRVASKPFSQEAAEAAYNAGPQADETSVQDGDQFIVKTTEGAYVYILAQSITGTGSSDGVATLVLSIGTI